VSRNTAILALFFLLLLLALSVGTVFLAGMGHPTQAPGTWQPPVLVPSTPRATSTPGWWDQLPTLLPVPSATPITRD
jgi:hypothetical protein